MESCQACEKEPVDLAEPADNRCHPYHLCHPCHDRLVNYSLRPNEWYNLAKRYGWWQFLLHDDFYDDDGKAAQPEMEVEENLSYTIPSLEDLAGDIVGAVEHVFTQWHPSKEYFDFLEGFHQERLAEILEEKLLLSPNQSYAGALFDICGEVLKERGAELVRKGWDKKESVDFTSLAIATTRCLAEDEGFDLIDAELQAMSLQDRRDKCYVLSFYRSPRVLYWLERNVQSPITESWGRVAACAGTDWTTIVRWIGDGRPMSLVALDCLKACVSFDTPLTKKVRPRVSGLVSESDLVLTLSEYSRRDPVPRVEKVVSYLLEASQELTSRCT